MTENAAATAARELVEHLERILEALDEGDTLMARIFVEELLVDLQGLTHRLHAEAKAAWWAEELLQRAGLT
jgi:hypothetical protein